MNPREWDTRVPFKLSSCQNTKSHSHTCEGSEIPPERFYPNHLGARGLHPSGALARTLWRIKTPLDDFVQITRGLGGYCRGPNTGVPKAELITIKLHASEQTRTQLHFLPNDRRLAPPRLTPEGWLRLARPPRAGLCLARPPRAGLRLVRRLGADSALPDD